MLQMYKAEYNKEDANNQIDSDINDKVASQTAFFLVEVTYRHDLCVPILCFKYILL